MDEKTANMMDCSLVVSSAMMKADEMERMKDSSLSLDKSLAEKINHSMAVNLAEKMIVMKAKLMGCLLALCSACQKEQMTVMTKDCLLDKSLAEKMVYLMDVR